MVTIIKREYPIYNKNRDKNQKIAYMIFISVYFYIFMLVYLMPLSGFSFDSCMS